MAIFRSDSKNKGYEPLNRELKQSQAENKYRSSNVHDPILTAVNEAQPFEQAADHSYQRRPSYLSQESTDLKDIFGQPIQNADISNPTRNRNERPLDTIRGFEYAITGDASYRDQLESTRLGWGFHEDFPYYNLQGSNAQVQQQRPTIAFDSQPVYQAANYSAASLKPEKKKKRGLFGKK